MPAELAPLIGATLLVVTLASTAQALTGFGFALVGVPLLAFVVEPSTAIVVITVVSLGLSGVAMVRERAHVEWRVATLTSATGLLGLPLGLLVLSVVPERGLSIAIAVVVLVFTALLALRVRFPSGRVAVSLGGFASGVLLTSTGMNGPPLVATMRALDLPPRDFRGTLQAVFTVQGAIAVAGFAATGQVSRTSLLLVLAAVPGLVAGWWIGDLLFRRVDRALFERLVLLMLAASGILTLLTVW